MFASLAYIYFGFVALTSRVRLRAAAQEPILALREGRKVIFTFWYEDAPFLMYFFGGREMQTLIPAQQGRIEDLPARIARSAGIKVIHGSIDGGGKHSLLELLDALKGGRPVLIPADSPHGAAQKCRVGCFLLAQEASVPIIPVSWKATFQLPFRRRPGKRRIPLPFNLIEVRMGTPLSLERRYEASELDGMKRHLEQKLNHLF